MNTNDFKPFEYRNDCFNFIFRKQKELMIEFLKTEKISIDSFDINCFDDQRIFKDYLQIRFIEELNEATLDLENYSHFLEEMVDAFNFLVETYIIYGWNHWDLSEWKVKPDRFFFRVSNDKILQNMFDRVSLNAKFYEVIESVGAACNLLKNRPWKSSQYLVDLFVFEDLFKKVWTKFNELCNFVGISKKKLFQVWSLKYQVNYYRIKTKY